MAFVRTDLTRHHVCDYLNSHILTRLGITRETHLQASAERIN